MFTLFGRKRGEASAKVVEISGESRVSLSAACKRVTAATTIEGVVVALRDSARGIIGSDVITVVRREGDEVVYVTEDAISPLWAGQRFPIKICISGMAIEARTAIAIPDILQDKRVPLNAYLATFVRSMVMVPIGHGDPQMAVGAYWQAARPITTLTVDRLTMLANAAADALARIEGDHEHSRQVA